MATAMDADRFWGIIEQTLVRGADSDDRLNKLAEILATLTLDDLIGFEIAFRDYLNAAYSWDLWGAAFIVHNGIGCSDDAFEYFRRWLVSRGRTVYEAALADPETLADIDLKPTGPENLWEFEAFYDVSGDVFLEKGGEGDIRDYAAEELGAWNASPNGQRFEDDTTSLKHRYPKLWRRFGRTPLPKSPSWGWRLFSMLMRALIRNIRSRSGK